MSRCDDGFVLDSTNGLCYLVLPTLMDYDDVASSRKGCYKYDAGVLIFETDDQLKALLKLFDSGIATTLFYVDLPITRIVKRIQNL